MHPMYKNTAGPTIEEIVKGVEAFEKKYTRKSELTHIEKLQLNDFLHACDKVVESEAHYNVFAAMLRLEKTKALDDLRDAMTPEPDELQMLEDAHDARADQKADERRVEG